MKKLSADSNQSSIFITPGTSATLNVENQTDD